MDNLPEFLQARIFAESDRARFLRAMAAVLPPDARREVEETADWIGRSVEAGRRTINLHEIAVKKVDDAVISEETGKQLDSGYEVSCAVCGWVSDDPTSGCETLRLLALSYSTHPDYQEKWKP